MVHTSGMNIETRWKGASMEQHTSESFENLEPADRMKYEIAEKLGLLEKVRKGGWKALSSRETGQIGGMVSRRKKAIEKEQKTK